MIKSLIKILIAVAVANALWHAASAYISFYKFQDAVNEQAVHSGGRSESQLRDKVIELAMTYGEPIDPEAVSVRRDEEHTRIETSYIKPVALFPGYEYQWPFALKIDAFVVLPARLNDSPNAK